MAVLIYEYRWVHTQTIDYEITPGCCPLCGFAPFGGREHFCGVANATITWKEAATDPLA